MTQSKRKCSVDEVLKLVAQLSPTEKGEFRNKFEASWNEQWDTLVARVDERNKQLPQLTEEEVYAEFSENRRERRAQSSN